MCALAYGSGTNARVSRDFTESFLLMSPTLLLQEFPFRDRRPCNLVLSFALLSQYEWRIRGTLSMEIFLTDLPIPGLVFHHVCFLISSYFYPFIPHTSYVKTNLSIFFIPEISTLNRGTMKVGLIGICDTFANQLFIYVSIYFPSSSVKTY